MIYIRCFTVMHRLIPFSVSLYEAFIVDGSIIISKFVPLFEFVYVEEVYFLFFLRVRKLNRLLGVSSLDSDKTEVAQSPRRARF